MIGQTHEDSSYSINQLINPLLGLEPLLGLLVMVVWWDVVIATPFLVQYQAEQCHSNGVKHSRKT